MNHIVFIKLYSCHCIYQISFRWWGGGGEGRLFVDCILYRYRYCRYWPVCCYLCYHHGIGLVFSLSSVPSCSTMQIYWSTKWVFCLKNYRFSYIQVNIQRKISSFTGRISFLLSFLSILSLSLHILENGDLTHFTFRVITFIRFIWIKESFKIFYD